MLQISTCFECVTFCEQRRALGCEGAWKCTPIFLTAGEDQQSFQRLCCSSLQSPHLGSVLTKKHTAPKPHISMTRTCHAGGHQSQHQGVVTRLHQLICTSVCTRCRKSLTRSSCHNFSMTQMQDHILWLQPASGHAHYVGNTAPAQFHQADSSLKISHLMAALHVCSTTLAVCCNRVGWLVIRACSWFWHR